VSGPCAKVTVECRIEREHPSGELEYVVGTNSCDNPQDVCPRAPGEDYTKCQTICRQRGHAEIQALALANRYGLAKGGTAKLRGHYYACEPCARALRDAGIAALIIENTKNVGEA